jgi:hypothetical protein
MAAKARAAGRALSEATPKLKQLLARLDGVRRQGRGWIALCPCPPHADKNPSLSLREESRKVLIKCQAGCRTESVLAAIGMDWKDLLRRPLQ